MMDNEFQRVMLDAKDVLMNVVFLPLKLAERFCSIHAATACMQSVPSESGMGGLTDLIARRLLAACDRIAELETERQRLWSKLADTIRTMK